MNHRPQLTLTRRGLEALVRELEVFDREQFQRVLFDCHTLLRDNDAMTPDRAFDTISRVLFIKLHVERREAHETFTTRYLEASRRYLTDPKVGVHEQMFNQTKSAYAADDLFDADDHLDISFDTFKALVGKLERFNLSKTGEDVKGIAFEKFLGRTFRGDLGQFFTPRPVVDFMVEALNPAEGEIVCDPAAGSGGFLIRVFDHVREKIGADVALQRQQLINDITAQYPDDADDATLDERDKKIEEAVRELNGELIPVGPEGGVADTRVGRLAWHCIYGTDKEPRAARTAKMNMIMHGDGHGGIHWHDGLVDINGVFEGRFDLIVTNPPFGATVSGTQRIGATPQTDVPDSAEYRRAQERRYGQAWKEAHARVVAARGKRILDGFEIGEHATSRKTEQLFLERCLRLLAPGGRLGIVLPNGNLNAVSQAWLRRWVEGKAYLRGVVALPAETFRFSGASVTASVVFLTKFTDEDSKRWEQCWKDALTATDATFAPERRALVETAMPSVLHGEDAQLVETLDELAGLGVARALPGLRRTPDPDALVRGAPTTTLGSLGWVGRDTANSRALKTRYTVRTSQLPGLRQALTHLRAGLRALDQKQTAAMWRQVREAFDYPVFMATPPAAGITATGDTGGDVANDLPEVLAAWRDFIASLTPDRAS